MKTKFTVRLDPMSLERARREAARRGITLASLIEQGLHLVLGRPAKKPERSRVSLPECHAGGGLLPGVDLDDGDALFEHLGL